MSATHEKVLILISATSKPDYNYANCDIVRDHQMTEVLYRYIKNLILWENMITIYSKCASYTSKSKRCLPFN